MAFEADPVQHRERSPSRGASSAPSFAKLAFGLGQAPDRSAVTSCFTSGSRNFSLSNGRGDIMPTLDDAVAHVVRAREDTDRQEPPLHVAAE